MFAKTIPPVRKLAVALLLLGLCGCGDRLVLIKGTVSVDGKPVGAGTTVMLAPEGPTRPAQGVTDENGVFVLSTHKHGDGAMRGVYKVVVINKDNHIELPPYTPAPKSTEDPNYDHYLKAYNKAVEEMRTRKPKLGQLSLAYSTPQTTPLRWRVPEDGTEATFDLKSDVTLKGGK